MDLLESVLRTANAEEFTQKFKQYGVDTVTLSLLLEEDLELLGIKDENVRSDIMRRIRTLHFSKERRNDLEIEEDYVLTALHCLSQQLLLHYASLSYALNINDLVTCDVKLVPATQCLACCVQDLHGKVNRLKALVCPEQKSKKKYLALLAVPMCVYLAVKFIKKI